eukprot:CAMPEP_0113937604 /NCGR_PEP_ID=MMETSP1339-20121228/4192_1 /TAXON_ID=94617 /ORGANISM="Fibrocapsa japonica" /LENGTH=485 /DNA_ID=CAMNT_0000940437 /DNA_START=108 /DNA_END=1568 /DNA_ORIENTATION=- /assembly_acc=CAM_ASM_000762
MILYLGLISHRTSSYAFQTISRHRSRSSRFDTSLGERRIGVGLAKSVEREGVYSKFNPPSVFPSDPPEAKSGLPDLTKPFTVLGIETSCDDTGVAVVRSDGAILGEAVVGQADIHAEWGGVVPNLAMDAHKSAIQSTVQLALERAGLKSPADVDAIGVTVGPGLEVCLRVGAGAAKALALEHRLPFVGVHHLEAHCLMARIPSSPLVPPTPYQDQKELVEDELVYPFLALLVSGGHCQLLLVEGAGRYSVVGGTLDDALGEAYDKAARLLGISVGIGGGPVLEALARGGDPESVPMTVPMLQRKGCDFSFAGLKNAFRMAANNKAAEFNVEDASLLEEPVKADLAASFQHTAIKHLEHRLKRAMQICEDRNIYNLAIVGGVAANQEIRERIQALCEKRSLILKRKASRSADPPPDFHCESWMLFVPPPRLCTDNGVMVAWAAIERLKLGVSDSPLENDVFPRWPLGKALAQDLQPLKEQEKMAKK